MRKTLTIIGSLIIVFIVVFFVIKSTTQELVTIRGEYRGTKGGMGVVDGVLLEGMGYKDDDWQNYNGAIVEVRGVMTEYPCLAMGDAVSQCFTGPMMINIKSIKVIEEYAD